MKPSPLNDLLASVPPLTRWQEFRVTCAVRWTLAKLRLCKASPFLALNSAGDEFLYAARPRLARLLFPSVVVLHPSQPVSQP